MYGSLGRVEGSRCRLRTSTIHTLTHTHTRTHLSLQDSPDDQVLKDMITKSLRPPQEKSLWAATSSQEIGWYHKEGKKKDKWFAGKNTCDETKYVGNGRRDDGRDGDMRER